MLQKLKNYFVAGLLALAPIFLTLLIIGYIIRLADRLIVNPVFQMLPAEIDQASKIFMTKTLIAFLVFFFVCLVGLLAQRFIFKQVFSMTEGFLKNIPIFSSVYSSLKEVAQAFFGDKSGVFKRVVLLEYPRRGIYAMGFVTQEKRWEAHDKTGKEIVSVFVPSPPNPATGFFIFVPKDELIEINITVEEGIRMVISGGAAVPAPKTVPGR